MITHRRRIYQEDKCLGCSLSCFDEIVQRGEKSTTSVVAIAPAITCLHTVSAVPAHGNLYLL